MVWPAANALYRKETYDNYPGARAILTAVYEGLQVSMDTGLKIESRLFANILRSKEAEAMIRTLFLSKNELDKGARRPAGIPTNIKKIGVIGAGLMGAGIAYVSAQNGLDVVLIDTTEEKVNAGKSTITKLVDGQVSRKKMTEEDLAQLEKKMAAAIKAVHQAAVQYSVDNRTAAMIVAIRRVAEAMKLRGWV